MRWYEGGIVEAITSSKSKNAIFVVYVEGVDPSSKKLTTIINDEIITNTLETDNFVAVKLEAESVSHKQFKAIYPNVKVPSLFFIGKNGHTLDIVESSKDVNDLAEHIEKVVLAHTGAAIQLKRKTVAAVSESFINHEQSHIIEEKKEPDIVCENGICHKNPDEPSTSQSNTETAVVSEEDGNETTQVSKEEKMQRAKELIDKKREIKKVEEEEVQQIDQEENAKQKEIERRKMGKDVQKLHRWQQDQEMKTLLEERKRAKNDEKAARDRILAQIAQDKAERALKFSSPSTPATNPPPQRPTPNVVSSNTTRLQFRIPDGSTDTNNFESSATLQEVRNYINTNISLPFRNYTLSTTFPRREFTAADDEKTLQELELCPNAIILVLPSRANNVVPSNNGGIMAIFWTLFSPILSIYNYLRTLVFGQPQNDTSTDQNKRTASDNLEPNPQQPQPKRRSTESTVVHRQGNIHRLKDRTDSDDENNTWNGNSTQQM